MDPCRLPELTIDQLPIVLDIQAELAGFDVNRVAQDPSAALEVGQRLLALATSVDHLPSVAQAHLVIGGAYAYLSEATAAQAALDRATAAFSAQGDWLGVAHTILRRNIVWHQLEEFDIGLQELPRALAIAREAGDQGLEADILDDMALDLALVGRVEEAIAAYSEAIRIAHARSDQYNVDYYTLNLVEVLIEQQDFEVAAEWLNGSLANILSCGDLYYAERGARLLAICENRLGNPERALELLAGAITYAEQIAFPLGVADSSFEEGLIRHALGQRTSAIEAFSRSVQAFARTREPLKPIRASLSAWWVDFLGSGLGPNNLAQLATLEPRLEHASDGSAFMVLDALSLTHEAVGDLATALAYARRSSARKERYWARAARRQAHYASQKHQVDVARTAAERERQQSIALANALAAVQQLNDDNEALVRQLRRQSEVLEQQAREDALTGIGNRRRFDEQLQLEITRAARFDRELAVGLADIDDFKAINDRFSHRIGDEVLRSVAATFRRHMRDIDLVARYGGEEFAFLIPETSAGAILEIGERLRGAIEVFAWSSILAGLNVTVSFGFATNHGPIEATALLTTADNMLYAAKRSGKNCVRVQAIDHALSTVEPLTESERNRPGSGLLAAR